MLLLCGLCVNFVIFGSIPRCLRAEDCLLVPVVGEPKIDQEGKIVCLLTGFFAAGTFPMATDTNMCVNLLFPQIVIMQFQENPSNAPSTTYMITLLRY